MPQFVYQNIFPLKESTTGYHLVSDNYIKLTNFDGIKIIKVDKEGLSLLSEQAFKDVSHFLRTSHLMQIAKIIDDSQSSENDKFVALEMLKNAVIAAGKTFPICQDTGTALITGFKGQRIFTDSDDCEALSKGVFNAYTKNYFRYSQRIPLNMYTGINTGSNLPAEIDIYAKEGDEYNFIFVAKGGGSANKTFLYQQTRTIFSNGSLIPFLTSKMKELGTSACPPYHIVIVIGGLSSAMTMKTVKLGTAGYLDSLPTKPSSTGHAYRDLEHEQILLDYAYNCKIGAQFGGKYFCHDVKVIRLPRHSASCPIGLGVGCYADRSVKGKITENGIFLENLETDPARFLPHPIEEEDNSIHLDLNKPMNYIRSFLGKYPVKTRLLLSGKIIVARDIAHANIKERLENGHGLPWYFKEHIIYYAGPAKTPKGSPSGSFGPTTAARMDTYVSLFQKNGGSFVMLAKGNRSKEVTDSCKKFGGFYLGSIGGPAALLGKECITHIEAIEYEELGMEAVFMITVKNFPAFIIIDDKGNDFFEQLT